MMSEVLNIPFFYIEDVHRIYHSLIRDIDISYVNLRENRVNLLEQSIVDVARNLSSGKKWIPVEVPK